MFDADRDAKNYSGREPVIAHPPCRAWGCLSHMANVIESEKQLAPWAVRLVQRNGGILEHPEKSKLWRHCNLPKPDEFPDEFGGYTILIDQYWFGHVANKPTHLYICGVDPSKLPQIPKKEGRASKSMTGQVPGTTRCTQYEREYTPEKLIDWMLDVCRLIKGSRHV